mgnify:CR=1 FL=1
MNRDRLAHLNRVAKEIDETRQIMNTLENLRNRHGVVVTDFNNGRVRIPDSLSDVIFTLLKDCHQKQLDALEKEFEEM